MSQEELAKAYSQNQTAMAMMAGMAVINPIFGAFGAWATNNTKKKIIEAGYKPPEGGSIFDLSLNDLVGKVKDVFGLNEEQTNKVVAQVSGGDATTVTLHPLKHLLSYLEVVQQVTMMDLLLLLAAVLLQLEVVLLEINMCLRRIPLITYSTADDVFDQIDEEFASAAANPAPPAENYSSSTYSRSSPFNAGGFVSKRSKKKRNKK